MKHGVMMLAVVLSVGRAFREWCTLIGKDHEVRVTVWKKRQPSNILTTSAVRKDTI
jgi:hypothetical protein